MNLELAEIRKRDYPSVPPDALDRIMEQANRPEWVTREMLEEYHSHWVLDDPGCGLGYFTWGLVHGAGFCDRCGWPGRLFHFLAEPGTDPHADADDYYRRRFRWEGILWAHPKEVERA